MTNEGCLTSKDSTPNKILVGLAGCFTDVDIPESDGRVYHFDFLAHTG